jgi:hypothetical protein
VSTASTAMNEGAAFKRAAAALSGYGIGDTITSWLAEHAEAVGPQAINDLADAIERRKVTVGDLLEARMEQHHRAIGFKR